MNNRVYINEIVKKGFEFHAAHYLPEHKGKCKELHGHGYVLDVGITGAKQPNGMIIDFYDFKSLVNTVVMKLDHKCLNDLKLPGFPDDNPTVENIGDWILDELNGELDELTEGRCWVSYLCLYETNNSCYRVWM